MKAIVLTARVGTLLILILFTGSILIGCPLDEPKEPAVMVKLAANEEFIVDENGLVLLEEKYNLKFDQVYEMAVGLTHEALRAEDVDAAIGFATDGKIKELELIILEDDKAVFPANNPAPVISEEGLDQYPQIKSIMAEIASKLDNQAMIQLNYRADLEETAPAEVARNWLLENELITEEMGRPVEGEPVIISSKEFMEQIILAQITIIALENAGIPVQEHPPIAGTKAIRSALMAGRIDLYWDYTTVVWNDIYQEKEIISDPDRVFQKVAERDAEKGLIWLQNAPLNKTYSIMMRREHARELDIATISEFARWVELVQTGELP